MPATNTQDAPVGVVRDFPTAPNRRLFTVRQLADGYMAEYAGRDASRGPSLARWCASLGERIAAELDDETIADELEAFATEPVRRYVGKSADGTPRERTFGKKSPSTVNRHKSSLSALFTWAKRRRLMPRGWHNPCREIQNLREHNARVRYLTDDERKRLLSVCRLASWPRLYLLVLMGITTGARRSELLGLHYRDLDLQRGCAYLARTKNGERRTLVLQPAVVQEIERLGKSHLDELLFASRFDPLKPMRFTKVWQEALRRARVTDFRFHDLRHSCASYLAMNGATLLEIADVLGHKQLDVTRRYAHLNTNHKTSLLARVMGGIL